MKMYKGVNMGQNRETYTLYSHIIKQDSKSLLVQNELVIQKYSLFGMLLYSCDAVGWALEEDNLLHIETKVCVVCVPVFECVSLMFKSWHCDFGINVFV